MRLLLYLGYGDGTWKLNFKREKVAQPKPFTITKLEPLNAKVDVVMSSKGKFDTQPKCTSDIKCFRC
jgi:hypothetical protein